MEAIREEDEYGYQNRNDALLQPKQSIIINGHKISIIGSSKRSPSIISALAIRQEQNFVATDEILDNLGLCNPYILFIVLSMALCWSLSIVNVMSVVFYESGLTCNANDKECIKERWKMFTIEDQFHIHEKSKLSIEWVTSAFFLGDLFGGVALSFLSDLIGRKSVVFPSILLLNLFGILSTYAQSYESFLFIRFCEGLFFTSSCVIVWIYVSECVSQRNHASVLAIFGLFWVFGYCSVAFIAKFVHDWRDATILVCTPTAILSVILWFVMPESFHFLAEHSHAKPLKRWLRRADKNLFEVALLTRVLEDKPVKHNFRKFFEFINDNRTYLVYLILLSFIWIINFFTYFGMSIYSVRLEHTNYLFSGLVELPAYLMAPLLLDRFGRKMSLILVNLFGVCSFVLLSFLNQSNQLIFVSVWLLAKFSSAASFGFLFVYGAEVFPTVIRNTALGICAIFSNLGATFGPHVYRTAEFHASLPWIIFGSMALISALCMTALPETKVSSRNKHSIVYNHM